MIQFYIDDIIKTALLEDINYIDMAADNLLDDSMISTARYIAKASGTLCGIDVALRVFELLGGFTFKKVQKRRRQARKGRYNSRAYRSDQKPAEGRAHLAQPFCSTCQALLP